MNLVVGSSHPIQYYDDLFDRIIKTRPSSCVAYFERELTLSRSTGYDHPGWDSIDYQRDDRRYLFSILDIVKFFKDKPRDGNSVYYSRGWYSKNLALAVLFANLFGWVTICHIDNHPGESRSFFNRLIAPLKWAFIDYLFDHFIATGTATRMWLVSNGISQKRISIVPHANPYTCWNRRQIGQGDRALNFGYVGQLIPRKNVDLMLRVFKEVNVPNTNLFLAGCKGVSDDNVHYLGFLNRNDLQEFYKKIDCLILPSIEDSWGVVINEAIQFDCAILASANCGAGLDLVYPGCNGYLFNPLDDTEFRVALRQISEDLISVDWQIQRSKINHLISAQTSLEVVASKICGVLESHA